MQINKASLHTLQQAGTQEFARFLKHQACPQIDATLGIPVCLPAKLPSLSDQSLFKGALNATMSAASAAGHSWRYIIYIIYVAAP